MSKGKRATPENRLMQDCTLRTRHLVDWMRNNVGIAKIELRAQEIDEELAMGSQTGARLQRLVGGEAEIEQRPELFAMSRIANRFVVQRPDFSFQEFRKDENSARGGKGLELPVRRRELDGLQLRQRLDLLNPPVPQDCCPLHILVDEPLRGEDNLVIQGRTGMLGQSADAQMNRLGLVKVLTPRHRKDIHESGSQAGVRNDGDAAGECLPVHPALLLYNIGDKELTAGELFSRVYGTGNRLVFQTCINANGNAQHLSPDGEIARWGVESKLVADTTASTLPIGVPDLELVLNEAKTYADIGLSTGVVPDISPVVTDTVSKSVYDDTGTVIWPSG